MDEKEFLNDVVEERMSLHYERFRKECTLTEEQEQEIKEGVRLHELLRSQMNEEQRDLLEQWESIVNSDYVRLQEYYYRAGFRDGIDLDRLIKAFRGSPL